MERYGGGPIVVTDYNPAWPALFKQERERLDTALGSLLVIIEHVGSTAVPGLAAKPIIDLLERIPVTFEHILRGGRNSGILGG
jgi:GrpB-like predicted nucleotidyltransferase (UPF0157 family)